jgi:flavin-dependent dehydrogenase
VLVVGGGPAGSSCARRLVRAGLDVIVVDRAVFPRPKVCAGWVTPAVLDSLDVDRAEYARGRVLQPITSFRTGLIGGETLETRYEQPVSYGIRRFELDRYLLARSGARLVTGVSVSRLERRVGTWVVNGELEAPMLVGAGGARWAAGGRASPSWPRRRSSCP